MAEPGVVNGDQDLAAWRAYTQADGAVEPHRVKILGSLSPPARG